MTDSSGFSRRSAIAITGIGAAGLALAGCKEIQESSGTKLKTLGKYEPYGVEPNLANLPDQKVPDEFPEFKPDYITIVRISSRSEWGLTVNHASFEAKYLNRDGRLKLANEIINYIAQEGQKRMRLKSASAKFKNHKRSAGKFKDETDIISFAEFGSNQQVEIFVWLDDQSPGNPATKGDVKIDPKYLISFSPMTFENAKANPNDSFFARKIEIIDSNKIPLNGAFFAIENYFCTFNEKTEKYEVDEPQNSNDAPKMFAMNIHFTVPNTDEYPQPDSLKRIPMVIDPDTGNGVGYEP
jgi:hypothetical protein